MKGVLDIITPHVKNTKQGVSTMAEEVVGQVEEMLTNVGEGLWTTMEEVAHSLGDKVTVVADIVEDYAKLLTEEVKGIYAVA